MKFLRTFAYATLMQGLLCLGMTSVSHATVYTYDLANMDGQSTGAFLTLYDTGLNLFGDYTYVGLNFNDPASDMHLSYDTATNSLRLYGSAKVSSITEHGDANSIYGNSLGQLWSFNFTWDNNVQDLSNQQYAVDQSAGNTGILGANGQSLNLADMQNADAGYSFALVLNQLGIRVGAGWFSINGYGIGSHSFADLYFKVNTGASEVPEPGTMLLLLTGGAGLLARRKRAA